jgi:3-dehydroquinate synthase
VNLIKVSLLIKKSVIEIDQFDKGIRRALNYGHTVGHAIEAMSDFSVPHGIAVIKGMLVVNKLFGYSDPKFERIAFNLINTPATNIDTDKLKNLLLRDKKMVKDTLQFIVPNGPGNFDYKFMEINDELCERIKGMLSD